MTVLAVFFYFRSKHLLGMYMDSSKREDETAGFLKLFSKTLKSIDEVEESMNAIAKYAADLVGSNSLCIFIEEKGFLKACGIYGAFPPMHKSQDYILTKPRYILESLRREKIRIGDGIIGETALKRVPLFVPDASSDQRFSAIDSNVPIESFMAVPLILDGKLFGVICAVNDRIDGKLFSHEQFNSFKAMSDRVIFAYSIVNSYSDLSKQQRISQEIEFAKQLQASLLPKDFPENDKFVIKAFNRAAKEVGGDFYDFVQMDGDRLLVVVGDACGKGIPACMLMAMTRSFIRADLGRFQTINTLMKDLNTALYKDTGDERFVTVACVLIDIKNNTVEYARAGHTEFLIHVPEHKVRMLYPDGVASGLMPSDIAGEYDSISFILQKGMTLLMFTDGITEALNEKDEEFGIDRLIEVFNEACSKSLSPEEINDMILRSVDLFTEGRQQVDDQTLVVIRNN